MVQRQTVCSTHNKRKKAQQTLRKGRKIPFGCLTKGECKKVNAIFQRYTIFCARACVFVCPCNCVCLPLTVFFFAKRRKRQNRVVCARSKTFFNFSFMMLLVLFYAVFSLCFSTTVKINNKTKTAYLINNEKVHTYRKRERETSMKHSLSYDSYPVK